MRLSCRRVSDTPLQSGAPNVLAPMKPRRVVFTWVGLKNIDTLATSSFCSPSFQCFAKVSKVDVAGALVPATSTFAIVPFFFDKVQTYFNAPYFRHSAGWYGRQQNRVLRNVDTVGSIVGCYGMGFG